MIVVCMRHRDDKCAHPLQIWVYVVCWIKVFTGTIDKRGPEGSCVQRTLLRWRPNPDVPEPVPARVRLYNAVVAAFVFSWDVLGIYYVASDGETGSDSPPCKEQVPSLYKSVHVFAILSLIANLVL